MFGVFAGNIGGFRSHKCILFRISNIKRYTGKKELVKKPLTNAIPEGMMWM